MKDVSRRDLHKVLARELEHAYRKVNHTLNTGQLRIATGCAAIVGLIDVGFIRPVKERVV